MKNFFPNKSLKLHCSGSHASFIGVFLVLMLCLVQQKTFANIGVGIYVSSEKATGFFTLSAAGKSAAISISETGFPGVARAAKDHQKDIAAVYA